MARPKDPNRENAWRQRLRKDPNRERTWRERIRLQSCSGLSIAAYCTREGISAAAFYAWRQRLTARPNSSRAMPPLFVPLDINSSPDQSDPSLRRRIEIELPHHVRLHFDAPPEPEWLSRNAE
jgi:hypothetical protein